jgi:hypothetical protein
MDYSYITQKQQLAELEIVASSSSSSLTAKHKKTLLNLFEEKNSAHAQINVLVISGNSEHIPFLKRDEKLP